MTLPITEGVQMGKILKVLMIENKPMSIKEIALITSLAQTTVLKFVNRVPRNIFEFHYGEHGSTYTIHSRVS
jgi:DNA-binding transcriptional regulator GbsR (MarR family)